jgi:hypothetical protein
MAATVCAGLLLAQFDGLSAGYEAKAGRSLPLTAEDLYFLNALGDLLDLHTANAKVYAR